MHLLEESDVLKKLAELTRFVKRVRVSAAGHDKGFICRVSAAPFCLCKIFIDVVWKRQPVMKFLFIDEAVTPAQTGKRRSARLYELETVRIFCQLVLSAERE